MTAAGAIAGVGDEFERLADRFQAAHKRAIAPRGKWHGDPVRFLADGLGGEKQGARLMPAGPHFHGHGAVVEHQVAHGRFKDFQMS